MAQRAMSDKLVPVLVAAICISATLHLTAARTYRSEDYTVFEAVLGYTSALARCQDRNPDWTLAVPENRDAHNAIQQAIADSGITGPFLIGAKCESDSIYYRSPNKRVIKFYDFDNTNIYSYRRGAPGNDRFDETVYHLNHYSVTDSNRQDQCVTMDDGDRVTTTSIFESYGSWRISSCVESQAFVCQEFPEPPCTSNMDGCNKAEYSRNLDDYCFWEGSNQDVLEFRGLDTTESPHFHILPSIPVTMQPTSETETVGATHSDYIHVGDFRSRCSTAGGNMLSIFSEDEYEEFMTRKVLQPGETYIYGLTKDPLNDVFRWPNGWVLSFDRWKKYDDGLSLRKKRSLQSDKRKNGPETWTWILVDYHYHQSDQSGSDFDYVTALDIQGSTPPSLFSPTAVGSWGVEPLGNFNRRMVCEATKERFALYNTPKKRNVQLMAASNETMTFTCTQPGNVIKGTRIRSVSKPITCKVSDLQNEAQYIECICDPDGENYDQTDCTCRPGYAFEEDQLTCAKIKYCDSNPCSHLCIELDGDEGFVCKCYDGFKLLNDSICIDEDECRSDPPPCTQACFNTPGSFWCQCNKGYFNRTRDSSKCEDINECTVYADPCLSQGLCKNNEGSFFCVVRTSPDPAYDSISQREVKFVLIMNVPFNDQLKDTSSEDYLRLTSKITLKLSRATNIIEGTITISYSAGAGTIATVSMLAPAPLFVEAVKGALMAVSKQWAADQFITLETGERLLITGISWKAPNNTGGLLDYLDPCGTLISLNYCLNKAVCQAMSGRASCVCTEGYTGGQCDTLINPEIPPVDQRPTNFDLILLVISSVQFLLLIAAFVCLCAGFRYQHTRYRTVNPYVAAPVYDQEKLRHHPMDGWIYGGLPPALRQRRPPMPMGDKLHRPLGRNYGLGSIFGRN